MNDPAALMDTITMLQDQNRTLTRTIDEGKRMLNTAIENINDTDQVTSIIQSVIDKFGAINGGAKNRKKKNKKKTRKKSRKKTRRKRR